MLLILLCASKVENLNSNAEDILEERAEGVPEEGVEKFGSKLTNSFKVPFGQ